MSDLISRCDVLHELDGCDYELKDWQRWKLKTMVRDIPSAEKTQLFGEDATFDCISRQDAIDAIFSEPLYESGMKKRDADAVVPAIYEKIKSLPSAEKTGRWILVKGSNGKDYHKCSCCLHTQEITGVKNYCSVCGADMMEVEHE